MVRQQPKMAKYLRKTWSFIERMEQASDAVGIAESLLDLANHFGFSAIFGGVVPNPHTPSSEISSRIFLQRMPAEWTSRYNHRGYVFRDPIVCHLQHARSPFTWEEAYSMCPSDADVKLIRGEAGEFGLRRGQVVPMPTLDGNVTAISFGGLDPERSDEARDALIFAANYVIGRLLHAPQTRVGSEVRITPRETDCLLWAAEGKSNWDIGIILGISRSTVMKHICSARDKLDAVNRTHAVVKAIRRGLIG